MGGGGLTGAPEWVGGIGEVREYNHFFIDAGGQVAVCNGQFRSSLIVDPTTGLRPAFTEERRRRAVADREFRAWLRV